MISQYKECDIAIIGGSLGGVAAALSAAQAGLRVILTEETAWIGGQATNQAVSALDEYPLIEEVPPTRRYAAFRQAIRAWYAQTYQAPGSMPDSAPLNPGNGWVSRLCFEPRVGWQVLQEMLAPYVASGRVEVFTHCQPVQCSGDGTHIRQVEVVRSEKQRLKSSLQISASYYLDATDLGDLLPLAGVPYVTGAESIEDSGEPHASLDGPHPERVQSFTVCFLVEYCPGENHLIRKPAGYARFRQRQPYSLTLINHQGQEVPYNFFTATTERPLPFWTYRRAFDARLLTGGQGHDIALINWPANDYRWGNLIDQRPGKKRLILDEAQRLSLGFLYWLQTEVRRDDGQGYGYPELKLLPQAVGTRSGLAQAPYIRESRRILGLRRVVEQDITVDQNPGKTQADFTDSVGIGSYPMDLHTCVNEDEATAGRTMFSATLPFQVPLGALIPRQCDNLIAACKNISTTHLTNGSYRLHPVEWAIGEAAGGLAAYCCHQAVTPLTVWSDPHHLPEFQLELQSQGVNLSWPEKSPERGKEMNRNGYF